MGSIYHVMCRDERGDFVESFNKSFCIEVTGDFACFTHPEMKVERVSYDVITPSAARGIFQAIFWKPAIRYLVRKIEVLNEIKWISVRRNEVGSKMSPASSGIFIEERRQQRAGLFLRDVRYRLYAEMEFIPPAKRPKVYNPVPEALVDLVEKDEYRKDENPGKYYAIFERRVRKGQCFSQPYLGCREFSCSFKLVENLESESPPVSQDQDFGFMLYDLDYSDESDPQPAFFRAKMKNGVITIPSWESEEVLK